MPFHFYCRERVAFFFVFVAVAEMSKRPRVSAASEGGGSGLGGFAASGADKERNGGGGRSRKQKISHVDWEYSSDDDDEDDREGVDVMEQNEVIAPRETAQEKRVRMAQDYLKLVGDAEGEMSSDDQDDDTEDDEERRGITGSRNRLNEALKKDMLKEKGRLRRIVAPSLRAACDGYDFVANQRALKGHKHAVTSVALSQDETILFSASKDKRIVRWDVETGKRMKEYPWEYGSSAKLGGPPEAPRGHSDHILSMALSDDARYLATGGRDNKIIIWDVRSDEKVRIFGGHRDAVSGLCFRKGTHTLISSSHDRSVRVWNVDDMAYVESLFGHQSSINDVSCLYRERAVTCSADRSVRFWKIPEESQLVFPPRHASSIDCVKMIDEVHFAAGGQDGRLTMWHTSKKRPCDIIECAHGMEISGGSPRWISSLGVLESTDIVASGSNDGLLRLWECDFEHRRFGEDPVSAIPGHEGYVNAVHFGSSGRIVVAAVGREHRFGRWAPIKCPNRVVVSRLPEWESEVTMDAARGFK